MLKKRGRDTKLKQHLPREQAVSETKKNESSGLLKGGGLVLVIGGSRDRRGCSGTIIMTRSPSEHPHATRPKIQEVRNSPIKRTPVPPRGGVADQEHEKGWFSQPSNRD